jgi:hypothetical protein
MIDPLQAIPQMAAQSAEPFPATSRYYAVQRATIDLPDGRQAVYVRRRFIPQPQEFALLLEHTVTENERLDHIANRHLGDPERFWQICDANVVLRPEALIETVGRRIRVTLPAGVPGNPASHA